jgi:SOS-response transcriptional repressor LexA
LRSRRIMRERDSAPIHKRKPLRLIRKKRRAISVLPLLGTITARSSLEATANEEPYSLAAELLPPRSSSRRILLEAKGDPMTGAGIEEHDVLIVEEIPLPGTGR